MPKPFRFTASMPGLGGRTPAQWREQIRRVEELGFSSVAISDHFTDGWAMDPIVAMTVAAEATSRLKVLALVFCNDFRHPVLLHKSMANLAVFSGGRVEVGLGAGWKQSEHEAAGLTFDPPAVRVERLAESIDVISGLFGPEPLSYAGKHYRITELHGLPKPAHRPPILVGGGGRKVLELAGRSADIVGINPRLTAGGGLAAAMADMTAERIAAKVAWARAAAPDPERLEFQMTMLDVRVTVGGETHGSTSSQAAAATPEELAASPAVLHGPVDACVDKLVEVRERFGISYFHLGGNLAAAAPIVAKLG
ncbi:TIGR03621 family F420-dependent LLM class oxidoreductase [Asanoa sp. WMMD1127]|uniref:TIGR03621 family F420-dependent LLM class oxidoreductase n=1 Tax=Asanoa sp. WMMD1127 TaxID=3016107 RepID=UPI0024163259|nr:TIGR03621 family F420-dependent LLM class oxidoreductase [Asanoa sp. WMMD1127]MDG4823386.1 TIGR03621 family F420-dependent LLM class oxidoreductase [Asanoa sp. WMMD1127]